MLFLFEDIIMSEITITTVQTKSDLNKFLKFQWEIYKDYPHWVPPLLYDKKHILDKKNNPFFQHAEMDNFLAWHNNKIVGRISAIKNDLHNQYHHDKVGFFGFFECINDQEVANKLFDTAKAWLLNKGLDVMRGPANPSSNDEWSMLVEGFDDDPRLLMPYNPPYYLELVDNYGFKKAKDLLAFSIEAKDLKTAEKVKRVALLAKERAGLIIYQMNPKEFNKDLEKVKYIYNKAWAPNWGFVPMTDAEIDAMAKDLKPLVEPSLIYFGEVNGELIGFALVLPDYNQIFKHMNGKLLPFNWLKLFTMKKKITWSRVITLGIIPEYQRKGLDAVFYMEAMDRAAKLNIHRGEASWILEDNDMMVRGALAMKGVQYKRYRVYDCELK